MSKYVMVPLLVLGAATLLPWSAQWVQANQAAVGVAGASVRILFEETSLMVPSVRAMLTQHPGLKSLTLEVMGGQSFTATDAQISRLLSKLTTGGSTPAAASLIQELNGRLASMPAEKAAQQKWLEQQIKIPVGQFTVMEKGKTLGPITATALEGSADMLNLMGYSQLVNEKGKLAGVSPQLIQEAINSREAALKLGWISPGHDKCLKEKFNLPFAIEALLAMDAAAGAKGVKSLADVQKEAMRRLSALYPKASKEQVRWRMCNSFSVLTNPDCDVFELQKECAKLMK